MILISCNCLSLLSNIFIFSNRRGTEIYLNYKFKANPLSNKVVKHQTI